MVYTLVNCTNSKNAKPEPLLEMSQYAHLSLDEAILAWNRSIRHANPQYTAENLYKGPYWNHVKKTHKKAQFAIDYLVVSAGLGLIKRNEPIPSYASTFTRKVKDSIPGAGQTDVSQKWWTALGGLEKFQEIIISEPSPPLILSVLSLEYLYAALPALSWFIETYGSERLIVLCSGQYKRLFPTLQKSWVSLDSRLTTIFGGKMGDLNIRTLGWILGKSTFSELLTKESIQAMLSQFDLSSIDPVNKPGTKQTENDVRIWIINALDSATPPMSKTAALKRFRKEGFGFEQKNFGRIFTELHAEYKRKLKT